jgi:hypothetical protein
MSDIHEIAKSLRLVGLTEVDDAAALLEEQDARIAELEAARIAYASEFEPDTEGLPDVGSIHENIRALKSKLEARAGEAVARVHFSDGDIEYEILRPHSDGLLYTHPPTGDAAGKDSVDAARYRLLRMYVIYSMGWPFDGVGAPGGLLAASCRVGDLNAMTQDRLDRTLDDMLGLIPSPDKNVRPDYQEWRARETRERIGAAIASLTKTADGENKS